MEGVHPEGGRREGGRLLVSCHKVLGVFSTKEEEERERTSKDFLGGVPEGAGVLHLGLGLGELGSGDELHGSRDLPDGLDTHESSLDFFFLLLFLLLVSLFFSSFSLCFVSHLGVPKRR